MKQYLIFSLLIFLFIPSQAQLTRKTWLAGSIGGYSYEKHQNSSGSMTYDSKVWSLNLDPNVGYFLFDKFAVGLRSTLKWTKYKTSSPTNVNTNTTQFTAGPFLRFYLLPVEYKVNILAEGNIQFGSYNDKLVKGSIKNYSFMAGPVFFFNSNIAVELLFKYKKNNQEFSDLLQSEETNSFQINAGFQIHLKNSK